MNPTLALLSLVSALDLTSPDFSANQKLSDTFVFNGFGCTGENQSPALTWSGAPEGTKSYAVLVHDPDAPTGGAGWWHWLVFDIPASETKLARGAGSAGPLPAGARQAKTDFGAQGFGGPCPPPGHGDHHYNFTLYALDVEKLPDIPEGAAASYVGFVVNGHTLAKATLTGLYGR